MRTKEFKGNKAITLISLIVTIIVLLILSGVAINTLMGENGLINRTISVKEKQEIAEVKEKAKLDLLNYMTGIYVEGNTPSLTNSEIKTIIEEANSEKSDKYYSELTNEGIKTKSGYIIEYSEVYSESENNNTSSDIVPIPKQTFTVTFNTNEGSSVESQTVENGKKATTPPTDPTKSGFVFAGWYSNVGLTSEYDFNTIINADTIVYAKWAKSLTIEYGEFFQHSFEVLYDEDMTWEAWADSSYSHDLNNENTSSNVVFSLVDTLYPARIFRKLRIFF